MKKLLSLIIIFIAFFAVSSANIQKGASYGYLCEYKGDNMIDFYNEINSQKTYCGFIEIDGSMYNFYMNMPDDDTFNLKYVDQSTDQLVEYKYIGSGSDEYVYIRYTDFQYISSNIVERGDMKTQILQGTGSFILNKTDAGDYDSLQEERMLRLYDNFNIFDGIGYVSGRLDIVDVFFAGQNGAGDVEIGDILHRYKDNDTQIEPAINTEAINSPTTNPIYSLSGKILNRYEDIVDANGNVYTSIANFNSELNGYYYNNQFKQTLNYSGSKGVNTKNLSIKYDGDNYICSLRGYDKNGDDIGLFYKNFNCGYVNESKLLEYNQENLYSSTTSTDLTSKTCQSIKIKPLDGFIISNTGNLIKSTNKITFDTTGYNNILSGLNISFDTALSFSYDLAGSEVIMTEKETFLKTFVDKITSNYIFERDGIDLKNPGINQRKVEVWNTSTNSKVDYSLVCSGGIYDLQVNGVNLIQNKGVDYGYRQNIESFTGSYPDNFDIQFFKIQYYKVKNSNLLILGKQIGKTSASELNERKQIDLQQQEEEFGEINAGNVFDNIFSCDRNNDGSISITYEVPICPITIGSNASTVVVSGVNNLSQTMSLLGSLGDVDQEQIANTTGTFSNVTISGMSGDTDGLGRFVVIVKWLAYLIIFIAIIFYIFK